jgi:hypothetical protein
MSDKKIKVAGYVQKVTYNGNIEYRNFSPDLVGNQLTSDGGTPLFTMGNFSITTNMDPKIDRLHNTSKFSDYYSLDNLGLTTEVKQDILTKNTNTYLNLDKTILKNYALFGSLTEFVRVSLENIIINWPASLFLSPFGLNNLGESVTSNTFINYVYDNVTNIAKFNVNTNLINNKFDINYLTNGTIADSFNESNNVRNLSVNYDSYVILVNGNEFPVIGFTGSTELLNDSLTFEVYGPVFSGVSVNVNYHIKPNKEIVDIFFNGLNDFEGYLLNLSSFPKYKATFNFPIKSNSGALLYTDKTLIWPVSDGYNIDYDTGDYISYATSLLDISNNNDLTVSNLMNRFLVSESITSFDTVPVVLHDEFQDTTGQKMNKSLNIYGRSFDDFNKYIEGISFAHNVTYNQENNTPDNYLKSLARVLGWDLISSVTENDLLSNYITTTDSKFSGQSVGLTAVKADIELWRRLILNSPWIWKSKGARKSIEFLLNFIGTPKGLIEFNEYVYVADEPIDIDLFIKLLELNNLDTDISNYPIDTDGYPRFFADTDDMYFQSNGLWYRETGGSGSTVDILTGNNPHVGPYDGGFKYINQLTELIPNFSATTITGETVVTGVTNLFTNYNLGEITNYDGETYVDVVGQNGLDLSDCIVMTAEIIKDPKPSQYVTDCGCSSEEDDDSLSICLGKTKKPKVVCDTLVYPPKTAAAGGFYNFEVYQYNPDGSVYMQNGYPKPLQTPFIDRECCLAVPGTPYYYDYIVSNTNGNFIQSGYACCPRKDCSLKATCKWYLKPKPIIINGAQFCDFTTLNGNGIDKVTMPDPLFCPTTWTIASPNITDPYTGDIGFGCKLTTYGLQNYSLLVNYFAIRADKGDSCNVNFATPK